MFLIQRVQGRALRLRGNSVPLSAPTKIVGETSKMEHNLQTIQFLVSNNMTICTLAVYCIYFIPTIKYSYLFSFTAPYVSI